MPDLYTFLAALISAAAVSAGGLLLGALPWRSRRAIGVAVGSVLGFWLGLLAGSWVLGLKPHWPPREDLDRFLLVLVPLTLLAEGMGAGRSEGWRWRWAPRVVLAFSVTPILLYRTIYLAELAGPGSREWSLPQMSFVLALFGMLALGAWVLLTLAQQNLANGLIPLVLAWTNLWAGLAILLSDYASGGLVGLLVGTALASQACLGLLIPRDTQQRFGLGTGLVGLFGLLVIGHFLGRLTLLNACLLFGAPLLSIVACLPRLSLHSKLARSMLAFSLVTIPLILCGSLAWRDFRRDLATPSSVPVGAVILSLGLLPQVFRMTRTEAREGGYYIVTSPGPSQYVVSYFKPCRSRNIDNSSRNDRCR